jgi:hypothetical protein
VDGAYIHQCEPNAAMGSWSSAATTPVGVAAQRGEDILHLAIPVDLPLQSNNLAVGGASTHPKAAGRAQMLTILAFAPAMLATDSCVHQEVRQACCAD